MKRKNNRLLLLFLLLIGVTLGYAALSSVLKINGVSIITKNTWDIHFENVEVNEDSVTADEGASINNAKNVVSFSVHLNKPGDFYEFTIDAVNKGTIDGMIDSIETSITCNDLVVTLPSFIKFNLTYADGTSIQENQLLEANDIQSYKVRVEYDTRTTTNSELAAMSDNVTTYTFIVEMNFVQATDAAVLNKIMPLNGDGTNLGDEVEYDGEHYYVLFSNTEKVTLIPKYNLKYENNKFTQDPTDIRYSSSNDFVFDEAYNREDDYCTTPGLGCNVYASDSRTNKDSTIKGYVDLYKQQLVDSSMISASNSVRLISLDELGQLGYDVSDRSQPINSTGTAPDFIYTSTYWTGEEKEGSNWDIWFVVREGQLSYNCAVGTEIGLRPIIEVNKSKISNKTQNKYTYAVWMWDTDYNDIITTETKMNDSVRFLKKMKVNEIYASIPLESLSTEATVKYISKLNNEGIKVYGLYGDPIFVMPDRYTNVIDYDMQCIKNFNTNNLGVAHIEGIHYDVEYHGTKYDDVHTCPDGESYEAQNCVARRYFVQFVRTAYQKSRELNIKVQFDISPNNTQFASYYDENGNGPYNILDSILDYGDDFILMAYGNGTRNTTHTLLQTGTVSHGDNTTITVNKNVVQKYNDHNKNIIIGQELEVFKNTALELENEPELGPIYLPEYEVNGHTIYKYTPQFVTYVFNDIVNTVHKNGGKKVSISIHDYNWFKNLYDK